MRFAVTALIVGSLALFGAVIPRPAPELTWKSNTGQPISLSKYKGKVVIVEILSTTCPHCQDSAKTLSKLSRELGPRGFQPLGIAINDGADVNQFVRDFQVNFPIGTGRREDALSFLQHSVMAPFYFPQMVIIDRNGVIQAQYSGTDSFLGENKEQNLRNAIQKLLSAGASKPADAPKTRKKVS